MGMLILKFFIAFVAVIFLGGLVWNLFSGDKYDGGDQ